MSMEILTGEGLCGESVLREPVVGGMGCPLVAPFVKLDFSGRYPNPVSPSCPSM